jgi:RecG-like helicase
MSAQYNLHLNTKVHFLGWMPTSSMDQICNTLATNCNYVGLTAYGAVHLSFMPFHFFHCRSWVLATLPTGQRHMLIGQMESGIQSHMQHKMSHKQHWQQFRQFEPHFTFNATFKYHSFRMLWIYVLNIVPQDWDLQVYHMIVELIYLLLQLHWLMQELISFIPSYYRPEVCFNLLNAAR